jgi:hypothetical protein
LLSDGTKLRSSALFFPHFLGLAAFPSVSGFLAIMSNHQDVTDAISKLDAYESDENLAISTNHFLNAGAELH